MRGVSGLCECGCGHRTRVATKTDKRRGHVKGEPLRFINGHHFRVNRIVHGMVNTPENKAYHAAKQRCENPNDNRYYRYGARGIQFKFRNFAEFLAAVGLKPSPQHSLDRVDNNGHYEAGNVRWATRKEQMQNTWRSPKYAVAASAA